MTYLLTGGAGYIGAHLVRLLQRTGRQCVVVDDLSTGDPARIGDTPLHRLDIAADGADVHLTQILNDHQVTAVLHLAGRKQVAESMARPAYYYRQNILGTANVLTAMQATEVEQLVFSSTALVYGERDCAAIEETSPVKPSNPYADSKLYAEALVERFAQRGLVRAASLRYANVAGTMSPELADTANLNLVPMVVDAIAAGRAPTIFGESYPTPDGTCVRDYLHVEDLAHAHLVVLDWLGGQPTGVHERLNVGTGVGTSVREMISLLIEVSGARVEPVVGAACPGDPATLVLSPRRIADLLGWRATRSPREIVESSWASRSLA